MPDLRIAFQLPGITASLASTILLTVTHVSEVEQLAKRPSGTTHDKTVHMLQKIPVCTWVYPRASEWNVNNVSFTSGQVAEVAESHGRVS